MSRILVANRNAKMALCESGDDVEIARDTTDFMKKFKKFRHDGVVLDDRWPLVWPKIRAVAPSVAGIAYVTGANVDESARADEGGLFAYIGNTKPNQLLRATQMIRQRR